MISAAEGWAQTLKSIQYYVSALLRSASKVGLAPVHSSVALCDARQDTFPVRDLCYVLLTACLRLFLQ